MRRAGIRVSLDGHGADELLGGYPYYVERAIEEMYGPSFRFRRYLDLKRTLAGFAGGSVFGRRGLPKRGIVSDLFDLLKSSLMRLGIIERLRKFPALDRFRGNYILPIDRILPPRTGTNQLYEETADDRLADGTALQKALFSSFHGSILPTWLTCFDRASMAHGIEARMPFMDWRLVTFSFALPDESKIGGGYSKRVLRQAMKGLVPDPIRLRTDKIGFPAPLEEWSRGALRPWLLDISASSSFLEASAWNGKAARDVIEGALAGTSSIYSVWPVINAHVLQQRFRIARGAAC
jgi:asparagine synthase (glutamine-hydrolysing)